MVAHHKIRHTFLDLRLVKVNNLPPASLSGAAAKSPLFSSLRRGSEHFFEVRGAFSSPPTSPPVAALPRARSPAARRRDLFQGGLFSDTRLEKTSGEGGFVLAPAARVLIPPDRLLFRT